MSPTPGGSGVKACIWCRRPSPPSTRGSSNWGTRSRLYDGLWAVSPSPIVALNRAVAVADSRGPEAGLALMAELDADLDNYHLLHASRAALLRRLGRRERPPPPTRRRPRPQPGRARVPRGACDRIRAHSCRSARGAADRARCGRARRPRHPRPAQRDGTTEALKDVDRPSGRANWWACSAQRRRQVDAREDRLRARAGQRRQRGDRRCARRVGGRARMARLLRGVVPLPRLAERRRAPAGSISTSRLRPGGATERVRLAPARRARRGGIAGRGNLKGMQQRLRIAQAMIGEPRLLLLDEPTSALDPAGRRTVRELLEERRWRGVAVLLNSHLLSEVELVCDRVAIIARGEVVAAGSPAELSQPAASRWRPRPASSASPTPGARMPRGSCASWSAPARTCTASPCVHSSLEDVLPRGGRRAVSGVGIVAASRCARSVRPRVFVVVALLTVVFLALYALGAWQAFKSATRSTPATSVSGDGGGRLDPARLSMFATLFLGAILRVPHARRRARGCRARPAAAAARAPAAARDVPARPLRRRGRRVRRLRDPRLRRLRRHQRHGAGGWWPDRIVLPALELAAGVAVLVALSLAGSVLLASTANGIAVFMLFGAGLTAGLLGQVAEALSLDTSSPSPGLLLGSAVRGALPGGVERHHRRHGGLHAAGHRSRAVRRRGRSAAAGPVHAAVRARRGAAGAVGVPAAATLMSGRRLG